MDPRRVAGQEVRAILLRPTSIRAPRVEWTTAMREIAAFLGHKLTAIKDLPDLLRAGRRDEVMAALRHARRRKVVGLRVLYESSLP